MNHFYVYYNDGWYRTADGQSCNSITKAKQFMALPHRIAGWDVVKITFERTKA